MKSHARVVVVGGGCMGAGVLYGLARAGLTDALLIERNTLASASSRLAGGFIPSYVRADTSSRIINRSIGIYRALEDEADLFTGWHPSGQMRIARQAGRWDEYLSYMDSAGAMGAKARLITPDEVMALCPLYESAEGMIGALLHPGDGYVGPSDVTMALARGARMLGAEIAEHTGMTSYRRTRDGHWRVETTRGPVIAEHLVLATGNYARQVGALAGLDLPTMPVVVQYWFTTPSEVVKARRAAGGPEMPITRDEHFLGYLREEGEGLMFGTYERPENLQLFGVDGISDAFDGGPLPADLDANLWGFERAAEVIASFADLGIRSNVRGPMQMTADGLPLIGPAWGVDNLWLAEGVPGGILWGGGAGEALAGWIARGEPEFDMNELDPRRFGVHANKDWIRLKAVEIWGAHSDLILPGQDFPAARPQATAPIYPELTAAGAVWGVANGWEMALSYGSGDPVASDQAYRATAPDPVVVAELAALDQGVGLADLTGTAEFALGGPGSGAVLAGVLAGPMPAPGHLAQGLILSAAGGVSAQLTVVRLADGAVRLIAPARMARQAGDILRRLLPGQNLRELTHGLGRFYLSGPKAAAVLTDLGLGPLPEPRQVSHASLGLTADVRIARVGAAAFDLVFDLCAQRGVFAALQAAGVAHGMALVGLRALDAQRVLAGAPVWGPDMHARTVITQGAQSRLALLRIEPGAGAPLGLETVWQAGRVVGRITSTAWVGDAPMALAWLDQSAGATDPGATDLTITVLGEVRAAEIRTDNIKVM